MADNQAQAQSELTSARYRTQPCTAVIFGGAGDLAGRKLIPALYNLSLDGLLPSEFAIMGFARNDYSDQTYRAFGREGTAKFSRRPIEDQKWQAFEQAMYYQVGDFGDPAAYTELKRRLEGVEKAHGIPGNLIFYLAIPPSLIGTCVQQLRAAGMITSAEGSCPFTRIIVEKPLGRDLASARQLDEILAADFDESQIFRIDHYLGKETVQNIQVMRFANSIFEPIWNERYIDHVQITVAEEEGVGTRASYYEEAGALRDMVQNHIMQLLCLTAMEPPWSMTPEVVHDHKLAVIKCLRPITAGTIRHSAVRAQYASGTIHGVEVPGYRREQGIRADSATETYVALKIYVDNWRWAGVPFYVRTGKRMPMRASEITVRFKNVPRNLFGVGAQVTPNSLNIRIQPDEGMSLRICSKIPGPGEHIVPIVMDFHYGASFGAQATPEAYERLLLDVMGGDQTLFMRRDSVEASWAWVSAIREAWDNSGEHYLPEYEAGSWGPVEATRLIETDGRTWIEP